MPLTCTSADYFLKPPVIPGSPPATPFIPPLSTPEPRSSYLTPTFVGASPSWPTHPGPYPMYPPTPYNVTPFIPPLAAPGSYFPPPVNLPPIPNQAWSYPQFTTPAPNWGYYTPWGTVPPDLPPTGPPPRQGFPSDYTGYPQFTPGWGYPASLPQMPAWVAVKSLDSPHGDPLPNNGNHPPPKPPILPASKPLDLPPSGPAPIQGLSEDYTGFPYTHIPANSLLFSQTPPLVSKPLDPPSSRPPSPNQGLFGDYTGYPPSSFLSPALANQPMPATPPSATPARSRSPPAFLSPNSPRKPIPATWVPGWGPYSEN